VDVETESVIIPEPDRLREERMVREDRWEEIHRLRAVEGWTVSRIARELDLDRKTVRQCLQQTAWKPYSREPRADTLLADHVAFLGARAPEVQYSARILFQELRKQRQYLGSYDTVKRFVHPLRTALVIAEQATMRFETPPALQSQIDWGQATIRLGGALAVRHVFVLTLGYSRRSFYSTYRGETLGEFLDAHERAFEYFGGHTHEHLYDRPRTVCLSSGDGHVRWNATFKAFADFWGFEPRVCRAYRARTKGKVESGVKYWRRNFLPGRTFCDDADLAGQLTAWMAEVADVRVHGTTHQRPIDRFADEGGLLMPTTGHPSFRLEVSQPRIVPTDYLVALETNRYSVPFTLIGQTVDVRRRHGQVEINHRGRVVACHPELPGRYQISVLPEHGPGPIARNARQRYATPPAATPAITLPAVEIRELAWYDAICAPGGAA
jgi:transposase